MPLTVVSDPRAHHSLADRKAQFELAKKLANLLSEMSVVVDRINSVRLALNQRESTLPPGDPLSTRLHSSSEAVDAIRRKIVATKEGGMITGEERLRENLADLYGDVNGYDGRPTQTQIDRTEAIAKELADIERNYDAWLAREMSGINAALTAKKMEAVPVPVRKK